MKPCTLCGLVKPLDDYHRRVASPDGRCNWCKSCALKEKASLREFFKSRSDEEIEAAAAARGPKACRKCKVVKGPDLFPRDRGRRDGRSTMCLTCAAETTAYYRNVADPEAYRARRAAEFGRNRETYRRHNLKKKFGITLEQYNEMLAAQGGVCAICGEPESQVFKKTGRLYDMPVDHDHSTGNVRSLLCNNCNHGLGHFKDSPELLRRAARYIQKHKAIQQLKQEPSG